MPPLTFFPCLIVRESHQTELLEMTAHDNSPTRDTRLTHPQGVPNSPLLHRGVKAILDAQLRASGATLSTRDAFLRGRSTFVGKIVRGKSSTRGEGNGVHHFPSPVRISILGVNLPDAPAPVNDDMLYAPARNTGPLRFSGHRSGKSTRD